MDGTRQRNETVVAETGRPRLLLRGLDSLYVSYSLDMLDSDFWDELGIRQEQLRRARNPDVTALDFGSEKFALLPHGRHGYRFVLVNKAFQVCLGEHNRPNCYVQFLSEALWTLGLDGATRRFQNWCASMGFRPTREESVSRADWAFDYDVPEVDFRSEHVVSRAEKSREYRKRLDLQTLAYGAGDVVVRIYDKAAEIEEASGKVWFHELWGQRQDVWRVEFQVRRERLRAAGIDSLQSLRDLQADLLRELATKHTTLRRPSADINRSRWSLHPLWRGLLDDIATLPQTGLVRALDPRMPLEWRLHQLTRSLYGSMKGLGTLLTLDTQAEAPIPFLEVLEALPDLLWEHHADVHWTQELQRRMTAYELGQW